MGIGLIANRTKRGASAAMLLCALCASAVEAPAAEAASRNRQGNRYFAEGKYPDAEKEYLAAQLDEPGRPELQYNLGNALLKQKKFEPAVQSLRQAAGKAARGLQASAWYNLGNALYESGRLPDAVQAYTQALRSNPSDRDAKHNLELALKQMEQQQQSGKESDRRESGQPPPKQDGKDKNEPDQSGAGQNQRRQPENQPAPVPREGKPDSISREQALQLLDAMQGRELNEKQKLMLQRRKASGRDW